MENKRLMELESTIETGRTLLGKAICFTSLSRPEIEVIDWLTDTAKARQGRMAQATKRG
jgi:hypothetical protein